MMPSGPPYRGCSRGTRVRPRRSRRPADRVPRRGERTAPAAGVADATPTTSNGRCAHAARPARREVVGVRPGAGDPVDPRREHGAREVVLLDLRVLRQGEHDGARVGRVGEHARDLREGGEQLLGSGDPVEVARRPHGTSRSPRWWGRRSAPPAGGRGPAHGRRRCHRAAAAREPVGVREAGGGDHVERTRADGAWSRPSPGGDRWRERTRPQQGPCPARSGRARWELVTYVVQGGAEAEHVAVAEDREDARETAGTSVPSSRPERCAIIQRTRAWAVVSRIVLGHWWSPPESPCGGVVGYDGTQAVAAAGLLW